MPESMGEVEHSPTPPESSRADTVEIEEVERRQMFAGTGLEPNLPPSDDPLVNYVREQAKQRPERIRRMFDLMVEDRDRSLRRAKSK